MTRRSDISLWVDQPCESNKNKNSSHTAVFVWSCEIVDVCSFHGNRMRQGLVVTITLRHGEPFGISLWVQVLISWPKHYHILHGCESVYFVKNTYRNIIVIL